MDDCTIGIKQVHRLPKCLSASFVVQMWWWEVNDCVIYICM